MIPRIKTNTPNIINIKMGEFCSANKNGMPNNSKIKANIIQSKATE